MILRGIDFGYVMNASGARNFFGQGYWFHPWLRPFGLNYTGSTFVAKTTTLSYRSGNMPLAQTNLQPQELFPGCIKINVIKGAVLNAVGLSGPGAENLLWCGEWRKRTDPFFLSFAAVKETVAERLDEWQHLVSLLKRYIAGFYASVGLEMNFSCPNTGIVEQPFVEEIHAALDIASVLDIPLVVKINVLVPLVVGLRIAEHSACDALCQSNTIFWDLLPDAVKMKFFGQSESPLKKFGGGGLSGPSLFPLVLAWIKKARALGLKKPIIGCGGIFSDTDARIMFDAGADAIQLGSVSMVRPWRVQGIIRRTNIYGVVKYAHSLVGHTH